ncbi:hypothetical protein [Anatilimnocola floriformis]|uniref:hypothetical protein n=1 Tax=Anatilimnocola floriformis TaxID=2948575 RepID=UPI0020C4AF1B|nr:hypothetical protein [Anatilimnocola floriformis]
MLTRSLIALCFSALVAVSFVSIANAAEERKPAPPEAEVTAAKKLVADVYKKEYEAAKTPADQKKLAGKMLEDAKQSKPGSADQFALYEIARNISTKIGDIDVALDAVRLSAEGFQIDENTLTREIFAKISPLVRTVPERQLLLRYLTVAYFESVRDDQLAEAKEMLDLALAAAKKANDPDAVKQWVSRQEKLAVRQKAQEQLRLAEKVLETKPADPAANATCGEYACFYRKDWIRGLPMIALGPPSALQKLAGKELAGAKTTDEQVALGDAWYDEAQSREGLVKNALLARSAEWYEPAIKDLAALNKRKVQNRLDEAHRTGEPIPTNQWFELLDFVRLGADADPKIWRRERGQIKTGHMDLAIINFPIVVNGAYELHVHSTRHWGPDQFRVGLSLPGNNSHFVYDCLAGETSGMGNIKGKNPHENGTGRAPANLPNGKPHLMSLFCDQKDGQCACVVRVDDKPYFQWSGAADTLVPDSWWRGGRLGLLTWKSRIDLHNVRFRLKSGEAWIVD